ncbi:hypothetical protein PHISP_00929 [Aspergillus sp. HF37]|nr:hypothetical protein PHISP_00929 [Aspergillus sp. HF37]
MSQTRHMPPSAPSSRSQLQTVPQASGDSSPSLRISGTLRLRGENNPTAAETDQEGRSTRRIKWSEDVVDNEGMGKKKSKVCCIYHKPRPVGESSSESESESSSDSSDADSDSDCETGPRRHHGHGHGQVDGQASRQAPTDSNADLSNHGDASESSVRRDCRRHRGATAKKKQRTPSPNAYEKMPKSARRHG